MFVDIGLASIMVTIALALLAQVVLSIRSEAKQSQALQDLTKSVDSFTKDTRKRFDSVDSLILGHTDRLHSHGERLGFIEGRVGSGGSN